MQRILQIGAPKVVPVVNPIDSMMQIQEKKYSIWQKVLTRKQELKKYVLSMELTATNKEEALLNIVYSLLEKRE